MLNLIGIGLNDEKDITLKGLELVKGSEFVYLENYTSTLQCPLEDLEKLYSKKIILAEREFIEDGSVIIDQASSANVSVLIIGDVFSATTHISLYLQALENNIEVQVINNASVLTAVGITGLELYKFGKTTSIPYHESKTPMEVIEKNYPLHTLCLLDLVPKEKKFMESSEALERLFKLGFKKDTKIIICAQLGSKNPTIIYTEAENIKPLNKFPQCIIVPGELHFMEEDMLEKYKI
ncbi:diphthine synthase [Candidatus Woesearchaeota archaeon]|nr:diphthine synthase [Candidatus Woesearchaeota archaeon]